MAGPMDVTPLPPPAAGFKMSISFLFTQNPSCVSGGKAADQLYKEHTFSDLKYNINRGIIHY